ncbi:putative protein DUF3108 [Desulfosarcina variabilis str. Montpellier]|uniref:DUF3108 domain-containing protein n=1 Tax=Desulfosarcina variabilis TaxID=2300 RepID=UPI003AFB751E
MNNDGLCRSGMVSSTRLYPALIIILTILATCLPGLAAEHPEHNEQLADETGVEFQPRLGEYHYEIRWAKKRVATGIIAIREEGDHYVLTADQRTTPFIDRIYRVRYRGETRIDAAAMAPVESVIDEEVKRRKKTQEAKYDEASGSVTVKETRTRGKHAQDEVKNYEIHSDKGIVDVFSAIFLARSFDWRTGEQHGFFVFIGEKQYSVTMACIGVSALVVEDQRMPVWVIQPEVRKIGDDKPSSASQRTRIFIAADESKDILKIKTRVGIGTVTLRLVKYMEK